MNGRENAAWTLYVVFSYLMFKGIKVANNNVRDIACEARSVYDPQGKIVEHSVLVFCGII